MTRYLFALLGAAGILTIICILTGAISPKAFERSLFTTTVNASTESLRFSKPPTRDASWTLPPGVVSVVGRSNSEACRTDGFETTCAIDDNLRLRVDCGADVTFQSLPDGGWSIAVTGSQQLGSEIWVENADGEEIARSTNYLGYSTQHAGAVRIPFVAASVQLGEPLRERRSIDDTAYDFWQPLLLDGRVQMSSDNKPDREKYEVLNESLDRGDVLLVGDTVAGAEGEPCKQNAVAGAARAGRVSGSDAQADLVWGVLSVANATVSSVLEDDGVDLFEIVLHTSINELLVTRFGAPEGHEIKASTWTVLKQRPNLQSAWVAFVSLVVFVTFAFEIAGLLKGENDAQQ